jgi:hypothetical protein
MSDRIKGFTVTLDKSYRDDAASEIMLVLQNIRGIIKVTPSIDTPDDHMSRERIKWELREQIFKALE